MKKTLFILVFVFFATQIIPLKYIGYLCSNEICSTDNNSSNEEEEENPNKAKEKAEPEFDLKLNIHSNYQISILKTSRNKYPIFCICIPDDYVNTILIPPPNNGAI